MRLLAAACVAALAGRASAADLKHVTISMSWIPQAEHCGFFEAAPTC